MRALDYDAGGREAPPTDNVGKIAEFARSATSSCLHSVASSGLGLGGLEVMLRRPAPVPAMVPTPRAERNNPPHPRRHRRTVVANARAADAERVRGRRDKAGFCGTNADAANRERQPLVARPPARSACHPGCRGPLALALHAAILTRTPRAVHRTMVRAKAPRARLRCGPPPHSRARAAPAALLPASLSLSAADRGGAAEGR